MVETPPKGVIARLIGLCAGKPGLTLLLVAIAALAGYRALLSVPLDAIPDLSDAQVIVLTDWPGRSPDLVEDQITYPLSTALLGLPKVKSVRGQSFFGLSFVYAIFEDGTDLYWARSRVLEYLNQAASQLPEGVQPTLGPDATGVGWVFQYALVDRSGEHDLAELRALQDFKLRYWLTAVEGVAEVASIGGFEKEYQVQIDPHRLAAFDIPLAKVVEAIRRSNDDTGGRLLEIAGHEHMVRGRGYIQSTADLEQVVIGTDAERVPVTLSQVAEIQLGPAMQRGLAELDGEGQTVGGIVVMRYGENALKVIERVKRRIDEVKAGLPEGVELVTTYDRSDLIGRAIDNLRQTLIEEMLVVAAVIALFLLHARSALVAVITLPVAVLLAFIPLSLQGLTANIMSLGGIAVAIGAMVDAAVVMVDNIHKKLAAGAHKKPAAGGRERRQLIVEAMQEVGPSIFFSLVIITVSFLPVFALEATEGRLFKPLAWTKTYSMAFAALLAITLIPALAVLLIRGRIRAGENPFVRALTGVLLPAIRFCIHYRKAVAATSLLFLILVVFPTRQLGSEFMPPLNEGSILYMPTAPPGMSITEAGKVLQQMDAELKSFPEVERVFGKIGRSTSATDPAPLSMVETVVTLKPESEWRPGVSWDDLLAEMDEKLRYPGMPNIWWMPIQTRTEMLATGIRSQLGIKVFGDSLDDIEQTAVAIEQALQADRRTAGETRSAFAERLTGGYFLDFDIDRARAARYGLNIQDVEDVIAAAAGGLAATQTVEGRERYDVLLRYARDYRDTSEQLRQILVPAADGTQVPLSQLATLEYRTGAPMIRNEGGQLVGLVFVDLKGELGVADYVARAKEVVAEQVELVPGQRIAWAGQYQYLERAKARLQWLVPLTLLAVCLLLYLHRGRLADTLFVLSAIPMALIGAFWLLYLLDYKLSVAVWVGMIAMAGLAAEMGLLMLHYLSASDPRRKDFPQAVAQAAAGRIRPMLMTSLTLLISLVPVMLGGGTGSDVMKRIAAPMVGGTLSALVFVLLAMPALYVLWKERR
ncbi:efflux RND transporter permease subunit [Microbulbifer halophilus]|uniref:Efflux RND transporter permease subunit n=1 Tax=Microbulbifer halophilus TaxID=453963 RepID=A0ABW5EHI1_9GAMM|nr:CusA/CzcA family heavy metal efflux RND transporter [Microbulbifer halophilus]MCW8125961.1 CusA/CzcA family heavy metal efflux RND transporter [Microbulbifer halophilus]